MMESELGDEEVNVTLLSVRGRVKAVRFVTRLGQRELLEFTKVSRKVPGVASHRTYNERRLNWSSPN